MANVQRRIQADLPPTRRAPAAARALLDELLHAWGERDHDDLADDARVVVTELVTNAVLHAGGDGTLHLEISAGDDGTLVAVVVDGSAGRPVPRDPTTSDEGGRGLQIVDHLASRWGVEEIESGGKQVWAELR